MPLHGKRGPVRSSPVPDTNLEIRMDTKTKDHCPYIDNPLPQCYCLRSESIWAERVLELCAKRYELCEYYRMRCKEENETDGEDPKDPQSV